MTTEAAREISRRIASGVRAPAVGAAAVGLGTLLLHFAPALQLEFFAAAAARAASVLTGAPFVRVDAGWMLAVANQPIVVSAACSGTGYYLMVAALLGWRWLGREKRFVPAVAVSLAGALPLAIVVNALRVVAVAQAHRWIIPRLPASHEAFAHMLTGAAVFLPSLIALNLVFEFYGNRRRSSAPA